MIPSKAVELSAMTMRQLAAVIHDEGFDIVLNKSKNKARVAKEIMAAYASREIDAAKAATTNRQTEPSRPVNPALENPGDSGQTESSLQTSQDLDGPKTENRGGARPGAGRPKGMTADKARMTHLSECPHPAVLGLLNGLFESWAVATGCPEIALSKDEAFDLALPWTNVLEYWGVTDYIPVWIELAITCTWNTWNVLQAKSRIAKEYAKNRKPVESVEVAKTDGPTS